MPHYVVVPSARPSEVPPTAYEVKDARTAERYARLARIRWLDRAAAYTVCKEWLDQLYRLEDLAALRRQLAEPPRAALTVYSESF